MFINLTNHPSSGWSEEQLAAARQYGEIVDIPFPLVGEHAAEAEIKRLADEYVSTIKSKGRAQDLTVHVMGEQTFCYALISKLQEEGIRCVASCTEHDTFINGQGQKVSTFHFTRFREYVPPRAWRWWKRAQRDLRAFSSHPVKEPNHYSWTALILVLLCEVSIVFHNQTDCHFAKVSAIALALAVVIMFFASRAAGLRFSPRSTIVSKLLANAIAPTRLGTSYLLTFVIHVGWATNAVLGLFTTEGDDFLRVLDSTLVCALGLLAVVVFFPDGREDKRDDAKLVFVTGISSYRGAPVDDKGTEEPPYKDFNMRPLIRMLQLVDQHKDYQSLRGEILILKTTEMATAIPTPFFEGYKDLRFDIIDIHECEKYGILQENSVHDKLRLIIKKLAIKEFPALKEWIIGNLDIRLTEACDYNVFAECFETLNREVQNMDNKNHRLIFNTTPGTAVVSTVMTLLSIDSDRTLYYYSQDRSIPEERISERLREVNKQGVQLESLLSQALDKLSIYK